VRISLLDLRGRAALAAAGAATPRERARLISDAHRCAVRLLAEGAAWGTPLGHVIAAGVAAARGRSEARVESLRAAVRGFEAADMPLHAAAARVALGGEARAAGLDWLEGELVARPERLAALFAPGH
jgi:hypothetical protein